MKNVYYLGPPGTFSGEVAEKLFVAKKVNFINTESLSDIADALKNETDLGILPLENSISSNVHQSVDLILNYGLTIIQEAYLNINFDIVGLRNTDLKKIKKVIAHPMAFLQCQQILKGLNAQTQNANSNISSQYDIIQENSLETIAISTKNLVDQEKLVTLKTNISDFYNNHTRFVVVQKISDSIPDKGNKISLLFKTPHVPGSLAKILNNLAEKNLNLTKIESRPIPGTNWEYLFWIDILIGNNALNLVEESMRELTTYLKCIGRYNEGVILNHV